MLMLCIKRFGQSECQETEIECEALQCEENFNLRERLTQVIMYYDALWELKGSGILLKKFPSLFIQIPKRT
jgi:hypothetical protein